MWAECAALSPTECPISTPIMRMLTVVGTMIRSVESGVALLLTDASST
jgi:hypothetical protein